ncbi:alpha/beta hydrolase [Parenemella sanctibonifatiensis]|uniref:Esterase n=1 Tax=Parenemella sanctibonifatiensis TaxID=2016505 RepID=A0A255ENU8_9ACTN|nr:alpha/beta fold hydrolase [Parenemella sanctibonifatiensis]OYN89803.1 esterase [Parenemella sanctibonifatiensis]
MADSGHDPREDTARTQHVDESKSAVLLCHGFTGSPVSMEPWAQALREAGHEVSVPLLAGHGTSWQDLAQTDWADWYASLAVAHAELLGRHDRVVLGALSMGGALSLRLAARFPDRVAGLMLVNPAVGSKDPRIPLAGLLKRLVATTPAIANDTSKPGTNEGAYSRTPTAAVEQLHDLWQDLRPRLSGVRQPVLLLRSTVDHVVDDRSEELLMTSLASENLRRVSLPNSYHVATLDNDADVIATESVRFLAELDQAADRG